MRIQKVLFICRNISGRQNDGGIMVAKRNLNFFLSLNITLDVINIPPISLWKHLYNILTLRAYGETSKLRMEISNRIKEKYDLVFFDGSFYGSYVKKASLAGVKTYCFFHNIEYNFYKAKYLSSHSLVDLFVIPYIKYNEFLSAKYATRRIMLNTRDAMELERIYGQRTDLLLPTSFDPIPIKKATSNRPYCLFVGSDFFANIEGMTWFIKNVSPYIKFDIVIVGSVCSSLEQLDLSDYLNVKLRGFVDDLDEIYFNAACVISPLFSGSGLKTKTIEALKYGRKIYGTKEAFAGMDINYDEIGGLCNTAADFITALNTCSDSKEDYLSAYSLKLFESCFSNEIVFAKLEQLINNE